MNDVFPQGSEKKTLTTSLKQRILGSGVRGLSITAGILVPAQRSRRLLKCLTGERRAEEVRSH